MDMSTLSDAELAFLNYATERFCGNNMREQGFIAAFQASAENLAGKIGQEYYRRKLDYKQFTK